MPSPHAPLPEIGAKARFETGHFFADPPARHDVLLIRSRQAVLPGLLSRLRHEKDDTRRMFSLATLSLRRETRWAFAQNNARTPNRKPKDEAFQSPDWLPLIVTCPSLRL